MLLPTWGWKPEKRQKVKCKGEKSAVLVCYEQQNWGLRRAAPIDRPADGGRPVHKPRVATSSRFLVRVQTLHLCPLYFHFIALFKSNKNWPEAMTREKREGFQTLKSCYQIGEGKKRKWRQSHAFRHPNAKTFFTG